MVVIFSVQFSQLLRHNNAFIIQLEIQIAIFLRTT